MEYFFMRFFIWGHHVPIGAMTGLSAISFFHKVKKRMPLPIPCPSISNRLAYLPVGRLWCL